MWGANEWQRFGERNDARRRPRSRSGGPRVPSVLQGDPGERREVVDDLPKNDDGDVDLDKLFNGEETSSLLPMRRWIDNTGRYSTRARLAVILDGSVQLLKENGHSCTVPLGRLSDQDRLYVEQSTAVHGKGTIGKVVVQ